MFIQSSIIGSTSKMNKFKTVWLSDIHLGYKDCKAKYLLNFLENSEIETLYLVGDIVDMWAMSSQFLWPAAHNQVLHKLISLSEQGTRVIYLPGNHDEPVQKYEGMYFGKIEIHREYVHQTLDGRKLLVLHGDQFDDDVCFGKFHAWLGDKAYDFLLFLNRWYNYARNKLGYPYWSLAGHIKSKIKGAHVAIDRYRKAALNRVVELRLDGVVCGHIHHPEITMVGDLTYFNDGDWIENCSALTEDMLGNISLTYWTTTTQESTKLSLTNKNQKAA